MYRMCVLGPIQYLARQPHAAAAAHCCSEQARGSAMPSSAPVVQTVAPWLLLRQQQQQRNHRATGRQAHQGSGRVLVGDPDRNRSDGRLRFFRLDTTPCYCCTMVRHEPGSGTSPGCQRRQRGTLLLPCRMRRRRGRRSWWHRRQGWHRIVAPTKTQQNSLRGRAASR